jgi:ATP-dependent Zn protease
MRHSPERPTISTKATDIARDMVARFGMHDKLGLVTYETPRRTFLGENAFAHFAEPEFREDTAREIDCAGRELTTGAFEKAPGHPAQVLQLARGRSEAIA